MKLPPKIILHVGMAKAGSTSIQNALDAHFDDLLKQGILFPRSILRRNNPVDPTRTPGHLDLIDHLLRGETSPLAKELTHYDGQFDTLLLSIENIFHMTITQRLKPLAKLLQDCEVHLMAVLRCQPDWFQAFYYERVVGGISKMTTPVDRYLNSVISTGVFNYDTRLKELSRLFDAKTLAALPFRSNSDQSLLERFLECTGISLPAAATLGRAPVNVSYSFPEAIEAHRWLNLFLRDLSRDESLTFSQGMKAHYGDLSERNILQQGKPLLSQKALDRLLKEIGSSNQALTSADGQAPFFLPGKSTLGPPVENQPDRCNVSTIFQHGIKNLSERFPLVGFQYETSELALKGNAFSPEEIAFLMDILAASKIISVHRSPTVLALAAGLCDRLVFGLESDPRIRLEHQQIFDFLSPPSPVVFKDIPSPGPAHDSAISHRPDFVFLGPETKERGALLAGLGKSTQIIEDTRGKAPTSLSKESGHCLIARSGNLRMYETV